MKSCILPLKLTHFRWIEPDTSTLVVLLSPFCPLGQSPIVDNVIELELAPKQCVTIENFERIMARVTFNTQKILVIANRGYSTIRGMHTMTMDIFQYPHEACALASQLDIALGRAIPIEVIPDYRPVFWRRSS